MAVRISFTGISEAVGTLPKIPKNIEQTIGKSRLK